MTTQNKHHFDNFDIDKYYKEDSLEATKHFKSLSNFPNALGYDVASDGFVVIHKGHQSGALDFEIPACLILKDAGYAVELIEEPSEILSADAIVNDVVFEIKQIINATNLTRAMERHFRRSYKKSENMLLHVAKDMSEIELKKALRKAAFNYPAIKKMILVYNSRAVELTRNQLLDMIW
jgi:hypothetical protein